jgi:hypothetical protein
MPGWGNTSRNMGSWGAASQSIRFSITYSLVRKGRTIPTARIASRSLALSRARRARASRCFAVYARNLRPSTAGAFCNPVTHLLQVVTAPWKR